MTRRLHGRLYTPPTHDGLCLLVDGAPHTLELAPNADVRIDSLAPGDLVTVRLDAQRQVLRVERVVRPTRDPFSPGAETRRMSLDGVARRLRDRMRVTEAVRAYLRSQHFLEVDTPSVVPNPGSDLHLAAFGVHAGDAAAGWLNTSPEYAMKRLLAGGVARCAQFARCWRAGERGARHQPEFTMLEWYRAWEDLDAVLADAEAIVRAAVGALGDPDVVVREGHRVSLVRPFARLTVREAFARYAPHEGDPIALAARDEATYYAVFSTEVEPHLGRRQATFLTGFPSVQASLARVDPRDPAVCLRAELYVAGLELCNAFDELTDPAEQRRRLLDDQTRRAAAGLPVYPLDEAFLAALEEGIAPCAGNALGFDRLVMLATQSPRLDDVMAFPR